MFRQRLDNSGTVDEVAFLGYRLTDRSNDPWTNRFGHFKSGVSGAVRAAQEVMGQQVAAIPRSGDRWLVTGAIPSSSEILTPGEPVYQLGSAIAAACGVRWAPELLRKQVHATLHSLKTQAERDAAVSGVYSATERLADYSIIVVDDICTRGSTLGDIARALRDEASAPIRVYAVTLAKSERTAFAPRGARANEDIPAELAEAWDRIAPPGDIWAEIMGF